MPRDYTAFYYFILNIAFKNKFVKFFQYKNTVFLCIVKINPASPIKEPAELLNLVISLYNLNITFV